MQVIIKLKQTCNQLRRQTTINRCHQEVPNILQRIEQENAIRHCQIGNHQQVASRTVQLESQRQASHPNYNNHRARRDLATHRQDQCNTARDRQSCLDQERQQLCSPQHIME